MQGIGLRQRDAFPKGAFKAFPELGGGAAGMYAAIAAAVLLWESWR